MNPYIKAAQLEREQLVGQIADLQKQVADLDAFLRVAHKLPDPTTRELKTKRRPYHRRKLSGKAMIISLTEEMLADGKAVHTKEILEQALARGIQINAKHKLLRISSILSREKDKFVSDRSKGWTLHAAHSSRPKGEAKRARTHLASVAA